MLFLISLYSHMLFFIAQKEPFYFSHYTVSIVSTERSMKCLRFSNKKLENLEALTKSLLRSDA